MWSCSIISDDAYDSSNGGGVTVASGAREDVPSAALNQQLPGSGREVPAAGSPPASGTEESAGNRMKRLATDMESASDIGGSEYNGDKTTSAVRYVDVPY